jgi:hypothetical protein
MCHLFYDSGIILNKFMEKHVQWTMFRATEFTTVFGFFDLQKSKVTLHQQV